MSKKHRCKDCEHRPGPRSTANMAKANKGPQGGTHDIQAKKSSCGCNCHSVLR